MDCFVEEVGGEESVRASLPQGGLGPQDRCKNNLCKAEHIILISNKYEGRKQDTTIMNRHQSGALILFNNIPGIQEKHILSISTDRNFGA